MFVTRKLICVHHVLFHTEFKYVIRIALSSSVSVWHNFFSEFISLSRHKFALNMPEALYCILKKEWAWKHNHSKDSRQVSPITDSQTVQAQACIDRLGHENNRKLCLRNTALLLVCRTELWRLVIAFSREEKCNKHSINQPWKSLFTSTTPKTWTHKTFRQGNGLQ